MGFLDDLSEETQRLVKEKWQSAADQYARKIEAAASGGRFAGFDTRSPIAREADLRPDRKLAALEYVGEILFSVIGAYASVPLRGQERVSTISSLLTTLREELLAHKWPSRWVPRDAARFHLEVEVDHALIAWLDGRQEWKSYEAQILTEIATPEIVHPTDLAAPNPLAYFETWALEALEYKAKQRLRAGLLEIHGAVLDQKMSGEVECWRRTYDAIAQVFESVGHLSEEVLTSRLPRMVADAAAAGNWSREPFGRTRPTGIFCIGFGSRFYPLWRVSAVMDALQGRTEYWKGRLLLEAEAPLVSAEHRVVESTRLLRRHRRRILEAFMATNTVPGIKALARKFGISVTALHGMVRGDEDRYSDQRLELVLAKIGCTRSEWDTEPTRTLQ